MSPRSTSAPSPCTAASRACPGTSALSSPRVAWCTCPAGCTCTSFTTMPACSAPTGWMPGASCSASSPPSPSSWRPGTRASCPKARGRPARRPARPPRWRSCAFAFLFRLSIGFLEKIGPFFMVDAKAQGGLGLSNELLGLIYGTYGLAAVLLGSLLGGMFVARRGLQPTLFLLCCAVNIPNITFLVMSIYQPADLLLVGAGVVVEKFFFGFGSVGFMIYLMQQLAPGKYMTTHYAFGTGLMGLCGMVTGVVSGYLEQRLGYVMYFGFVMVATIPSFIASWLAPFHHSEEASASLAAAT